MHPYISGCAQDVGSSARWGSLWISGWAYIVDMVISCYHSVLQYCWPVADFFIAKQTSLHPFDFVRNLFHYLCLLRWQKNVPSRDATYSYWIIAFHGLLRPVRTSSPMRIQSVLNAVWSSLVASALHVDFQKRSDSMRIRSNAHTYVHSSGS